MPHVWYLETPPGVQPRQITQRCLKEGPLLQTRPGQGRSGQDSGRWELLCSEGWVGFD